MAWEPVQYIGNELLKDIEMENEGRQGGMRTSQIYWK